MLWHLVVCLSLNWTGMWCRWRWEWVSPSAGIYDYLWMFLSPGIVGFEASPNVDTSEMLAMELRKTLQGGNEPRGSKLHCSHCKTASYHPFNWMQIPNLGQGCRWGMGRMPTDAVGELQEWKQGLFSPVQIQF
jgi:hypothetical protein